MPLDDYPRPCVTVDIVVFTILDTLLNVLVVRRAEPPFEGAWALPGGFVRVRDEPDDRGEGIEAAARRELAEETGLPEGAIYLAQLGAFGEPDRDPRTRVITIAYYALMRPTLAPFVTAGGDADDVAWVPLQQLPERQLAFDHPAIVDAALERCRERIDGSAIAFELVPETFTVSELRAVYEVIKGVTYDAPNFRRRFNRMLADGLLEEAPGKRLTNRRPAKVFRFVAS